MRNLIMVFFLLSSVALFAKEELFVNVLGSDIKVLNKDSDTIAGVEAEFKADKKQGNYTYYLDLRARYSSGKIESVTNSFKELEGIIGIVHKINNEFTLNLGLGLGSYMWDIEDSQLNWHPFVLDLGLGYSLSNVHHFDFSYRLKYTSQINNSDSVYELSGKVFTSEIGVDYVYNFYSQYDLVIGYEYTQHNNEDNDSIYQRHLIKLGIGYQF